MVYSDELYHHGIKGQKWGVRRYQNKDGSLTKKGKARYYSNGELNEEGRNENIRRRSKRYDKSVAIANKLSRDSEYSKYRDEFTNAEKTNEKDYSKSRDEWLSGKGPYKKMDYYKFKDKTSSDWFSSANGKNFVKSKEDFRKVVEEKVKKELGSDVFNKKIIDLPYYEDGRYEYYIDTVGKSTVDDIVRYEQHKHLFNKKR